MALTLGTLTLGTLALGACATGRVAPAGTGVATATQGTSTVTAAPPATVTPVAGAVEREATWRFVEARGTAVVLEVDLGAPPCDVVTAVEHTETDDDVHVVVRTGAAQGADCSGGLPAVLVTARLVVQLKAPLGTRELR